MTEQPKSEESQASQTPQEPTKKTTEDIAKELAEMPIDQWRRNTELCLSELAMKTKQGFDWITAELQRTQQAVLEMMARGTANQKKLIIPKDQRKPYVRN